MQYGNGTYLQLESGPFAYRYVKGRAILPNGELRSLDFSGYGIPDTFFSVPCRVSLGGKKVRGWATVECVSGSTVYVDDSDPLVVKFFPFIILEEIDTNN